MGGAILGAFGLRLGLPGTRPRVYARRPERVHLSEDIVLQTFNFALLRGPETRNQQPQSGAAGHWTVSVVDATNVYAASSWKNGACPDKIALRPNRGIVLFPSYPIALRTRSQVARTYGEYPRAPTVLGQFQRGIPKLALCEGLCAARPKDNNGGR